MGGTTEDRKVIIVGAGLAGCLSALLLARRGCVVHVYEQRQDPTAPGHETPQQRSINLAISTRGLTALAQANLDEKVRQIGVPMHGRCVHSVEGELDYQPYGQRGQYLLSVSRNALNSLLITECKKHPERIHLHFSYKFVAADFDLPAAHFSTTNSNGDSKVVFERGDAIIGADGTWSKVRGTMLGKAKSEMNYSQEFITSKYKEITLTGDVKMDKNWLHIWPRHRFMLIALPNSRHNNQYTCTLFMEGAQFRELSADEHKVDHFFRANFPDIFHNLAQDIGKQFLASPTPPLVTVKCDPYHLGDKCVLIGDAAHSMVPFFGQGSQAAFEDARILAEIMSPGAHDFGAKFTALRKVNADAISDLSLANYRDMASNSANNALVLAKKMGILINRFFPDKWTPLYSMVSFSNIPYSEAVRRSRSQDKMAASLLSASAAVAIGGALSIAVLCGMRRTNNSL